MKMPVEFYVDGEIGPHLFTGSYWKNRNIVIEKIQ